ncbi:MAG: hypothetical protein LBI33_10895 [Propionibacteriaceae bacterium]|jgi:hypothetical protein|nr:hypothetical protein [Propionibacteriaceae bacterium]
MPVASPLSQVRALAHKWWPYLVIFVVVCFVSTADDWSPFSLARGTDSTVYGYIGQAMTQGRTPYTDAWDNKGPLLYTLNYLGMLLNDRYGIFLIGFAATLATGILGYAFARLFASRLTAVAASVVTLLTVTYTLAGGNLTEGYALPFIVAALYLIAQAVVSGRFTWWQSVVIGVCSAACFLLRINLVAPIVAFGLVLFVCTLVRRRVVAALQLAVHVAAGAVLTIIPFVVYLAAKGALRACLEAAYTSQFVTPPRSERLQSAYLILAFTNRTYVLAITATFLLVSAVLLVTRRISSTSTRVMVVATWAGMLVNLYANTITGAAYEHYATTFAAVMLFPVVCFFRLVERLTLAVAGRLDWASLTAGPRAVTAGAITLIVFVMSWGNIDYTVSTVAQNWSYRTHAGGADANYVDLIVSNTTPDDEVQVLGGIHPYLLLRSHRESASRFFYTPDGLYIDPGFAASARQEIADTINERPPELIIVSVPQQADWLTATPAGVGPLLDSSYERFFSDDNYIMFRRITT